MANGCNDLITRAELQEAKQLYEHQAEVISGENSGGTELDTSTNPVTSKVIPTLPYLLDNIQEDANEVIAELGFAPLGDGVWVAGKTFTSYNQYLVYNGATYKVKSDTPIPYGPIGSTPDLTKVEPFLLGSPLNITAEVDMPFNINKPLVSLSGGLTTERDSGSTRINNSGLLENIGVDEAQLSVDGLGCFEECTNLLLWSDDLLQTAWSVVTGSASTDGTLTPDGVTEATKLIPDAGESSYFTQVTNFTSGLEYTCQVMVKENGFDEVLLLATSQFSGGTYYTTFNLSTGTKIDTGDVTSSMKAIGDGWFLLAITVTATATIASSFQICRVNDGDGVNGVYTSHALVTAGRRLLCPHIKTESAVVTRAPDKHTIPNMNNLPAPGLPWTISFECDFSKSFEFTGLFVPNNINQPDIAMLSTVPRVPYGAVRAGGSSYSVGASVGAPAATENERVTLVYTGATLSFYRNGVLIEDISITSLPDYDIDGHMDLGGKGVTPGAINAHFRNFKIYHRALTSAEVASLGGPA